MAKRVALIGHPVTHSLSGVLQQAAFDSAGHRRPLRAGGPAAHRPARDDRHAARGRHPGRQHHGAVQGTSGAHDGPPVRGRPRDRGGRHRHPRRRPADRPQHGRARLPDGARRAGGQAEDAQGGGRPGRRWRLPAPSSTPSSHPASSTSSCSTATSIVRRAWCATSARAPPTWSCVPSPGTSRCSRRSWPAPSCSSTPAPSAGTPDETPIPAELLPPELLVLDLLYTPRESRLLREAAGGRSDRRPERRRDAHPPERGRVRAVDGSGGTHRRPDPDPRVGPRRQRRGRRGGCRGPRARG